MERLLDKVKFYKRLVKIIVGSLLFFLLLLFAIGTLYFPLYIAIILLLLESYWIYKLVRLVINSIKVYYLITITSLTDWYQEGNNLRHLDNRLNELISIKNLLNEKFHFANLKFPFNYIFNFFSFKRYYSTYIYISNKINELSKFKNLNILDTDSIYHLVIIPEYKEEVEIIEKTIDHIIEQNFPKDKIIIAIATEERDKDSAKTFAILNKKYSNTFKGFWDTSHILKEDEVAGKAANIRYAAIECTKRVERENMDLKNVIVTICDADSLLHKEYISNLTYNFCINENRFHTLFHGANLYYSNFTEIPFIERIFATMTSLWYISKLESRYLDIVSTFSLSLYTLKEIDYWDPKMAAEDAYIYMQMFNIYGEKFNLSSIFLPIYMTMPNNNKYIDSLRNFYTQTRRQIFLALIVDIEMFNKIIYNNKINGITKLKLLIDRLEIHILWPIYWLMFTFGFNILVFFNAKFINSPLGNLFTITTQIIFYIAIFLFLGIIVIDYRLRDKAPFTKFKKIREFFNLFHWVYMPVVGIYAIFLPYLESNIRLILDKPVEFKPTDKTYKDKLHKSL